MQQAGQGGAWAVLLTGQPRAAQLAGCRRAGSSPYLQRRVPLAAVAAEHHLHEGLDQVLQGGHIAQVLQQAGGLGARSKNEEYVRMQAGLDRQTP